MAFFKSLIQEATNWALNLAEKPLLLGATNIDPMQNQLQIGNISKKFLNITPYAMEARNEGALSPLTLGASSVSWNNYCIMGSSTERQFAIKNACTYMGSGESIPLLLNNDPEKPLSFSELPHGLMLHWQGRNYNGGFYDWDHCWTPIFNQNYWKSGEDNRDQFEVALGSETGGIPVFAVKDIAIREVWDANKKKFVAYLEGHSVNDDTETYSDSSLKFSNSYWVLTQAYII